MRFLVRFFLGCAAAGAGTVLASTLAVFHTPIGDMEVELYDTAKPVTVKNFMLYVNRGLYRKTFVQRWEPKFVIQGGGYYALDADPYYARVPVLGQITNEAQVGPFYSNTYGTIAMARQDGVTNSASSQWFFNLGDNSALDSKFGGFTVFGRVLRGTNVLEQFNNPGTVFAASVAAFPELSELPVTVASGVFDLVYTDISLLKVHIARAGAAGREISWNSISNKVNRVEFSDQVAPVWQELISTNGTGQTLRILDAPAASNHRVYRVTVQY